MDGLCKGKHHIRLQLEEHWGEAVQPAILEVSKAIEDLQAKGAVVPVWPPLFGTDPSTLEEPWDNYTDEELDQRGWTDPEPLIAEIQKVQAAMEAPGRSSA